LGDDGSSGLSQLATTLRASNYRTLEMSLLQGDVPGTCNLLVVAGISDGIGQAQIQRVNQFFLTGGRLAFLVDPPVKPEAAAWLRPFGIGVGKGIIVDTSPGGRQVGAGPEMPLGVSYTDHPITRGFKIATMYDGAVPLTIERQETGVPTPLVATGPGSFEKTDLGDPSLVFRDGRDHKGPLTVAIAVTGPRAAQAGRLMEPRLVAFGDSDWVTNAVFGRQGNRDLALRVIAWLAGEEEAHIVSTGDRENRRTAMTEQVRRTMYLVNLLLLPLIPLVAGIIQFVRSRK